MWYHLILMGEKYLMKKNILLFGCIICCFILVTLSYQPILAEESIETITQQVKESKNDCDCEKKGIVSIWQFPIICAILHILIKFVERYHLWPIGFPPLLVPLYGLAGILRCNWLLQ